ncbi:hypothetical protein APHAL10511_002887 [Amanita phalloides]|nr:hypothetical protein APHAL10511_002887 [Amanita phalloides]
MNIPQDLLNALDLRADASDEDVCAELLALITSAVHDELPRLPLSEISHLIHDYHGVSFLSPLDALSILLLSTDPAARDIIALLSNCSPAKEVVIATQEVLERLENIEVQSDDGHQSPLDQLIVLIDVYASAVPRLKLRRKTASETLRPLILDLAKVVRALCEACSIAQGRSIIERTSNFVQMAKLWVTSATDNGGEQSLCDVVLMDLLMTVLVACAQCIQSCLARRSFATYYPRLVVDPNLDTHWEVGEQAVQLAIHAASAIGYMPDALISKPSAGHLIIMAHMNSKMFAQSTLLEDLLPTIVSAFRSGVALDECITLLLTLLHDLKETTISPEVITPLCTMLASVASTHPDPTIRHQSFRILALLLSRSPPTLRMEALKELTTDRLMPQMRTAAVGLVKEAVLEGLSSSSPNMFASRIFLQAFGPILFRPDPPDYLSKNFSAQELCESYETSRLAECLSLYYVLLLRDRSNKTGIRDRDIINNIDKNFLSPLRSALNMWTSNNSENVVMPIVSLQLGLDRVDSAAATLIDS